MSKTQVHFIENWLMQVKEIFVKKKKKTVMYEWLLINGSQQLGQ